MGPASEDFNWRIEEACVNAWPSETNLLRDGWLVRRSGGPVRRSNSVNPLRGPRGPSVDVVAFAERFYAEQGQDAIFRVPDIAPDLDDVLTGRGYGVEDRTLTLVADLSGRPVAGGSEAGVHLAASPSRSWLAARSRLAGADAAGRDIYEKMTRLIRLPARFAGIDVDGETVAQAYAVIHRRVAVVNSVATDPDHRRRGLGRRAVGGLIDWACAAGADTAALQVVADNAPALALYRSLGFDRLAYGYHYRVRR